MKTLFLLCIWMLGIVFAKPPRKLTDNDGMHPAGFEDEKTSGPKIIRDWNDLAQKELNRAMELERNRNTNRARNLIFFIGDGFALPTIAAARKLKSQLEDIELTDATLVFDEFPHIGVARTYNVDRYVPDSAATATAFLCGEKGPYSTLGVSQYAEYDNCTSVQGNRLKSMVKKGMDEGKWGGVVTTTRITHATPAAAYASVANRDWEAVIPNDVPGWELCTDSAEQLVHDVDNLDLRVILGGGRRSLLSTNDTDPVTGQPGRREDDRDLMQEWVDMREENGDKFEQVVDKAAFDEVDAAKLDYLMGLFAYDHMDFEWHRSNKTEQDQPSLSAMVKKAIHLLEQNEDGFVLFVESGRIDQAHHDNNAFLALTDTLEFEKAIKVALEYTNEVEDTLIVVSGDHSHVFNIGGYPTMDNDLFGLDNSWWPPADNKPYTTLTYANGPGFYYHRTVNGSITSPELPRMDLTNEDTGHPDFVQDAGIPLDYDTHGGEDVGIYAIGPMAHLFHGVHEQSYIPHVMMYAACIGDNKDHCKYEPPPGGHASRTTSAPLIVVVVLSIMVWWSEP